MWAGKNEEKWKRPPIKHLKKYVENDGSREIHTMRMHIKKHQLHLSLFCSIRKLMSC